MIPRKADTGFQKEGEGAGYYLILKCGEFMHIHATFVPLFMKFGGPQKGGGRGGPDQQPPNLALPPPLLPSSCQHNRPVFDTSSRAD